MTFVASQVKLHSHLLSTPFHGTQVYLHKHSEILHVVYTQVVSALLGGPKIVPGSCTMHAYMTPSIQLRCTNICNY